MSAPATVRGREPRDISATLTNVGTTPVRVLPNQVRLFVEGTGAEYVPYPGPPIDPWAGALDLAPGERTTITFADASDKRGVWRLPRGSYSITAVYEVTADLALPPGLIDANRLWRGPLRSSPVKMTVE